MSIVGPPVEALTRRLVATPADLLAAPIVAERGVVAVNALVADVIADLDPSAGPMTDAWHEALCPASADDVQTRWLTAVAVAAWLAHDGSLRGLLQPQALLALCADDLHPLVAVVPPDTLVRDSDRREELVRLLLRAAGATPTGETEAQAADRLATLDTVTRNRVIAETRAAEERAAAVREALRRKAAEEAAARAGRE